MGIKFLSSHIYNDPELGPVKLRVLSSAVRFTARWKSDCLHITVPARTTYAQFAETMESWRPKLLSLKTQRTNNEYYDGFEFSIHDWAFSIRAVEGWRSHYVGWERISQKPADKYIIKVSPSDDLSSPSMRRTIGKAILHIASIVAKHRLLPQARQEAERLGLSSRVRTWSIGRGQRRMGCCKANGDISLSAVLMFFPDETRRATITHELAHLSHFDHSPAFYSLWENYLGHSHRLYRPDPAKTPLY